MRKIKKAILITGGIIISLFSLVFITLNLLDILAKDIAPINDSDLQLEKVIVFQEENAYYDLIKLSPQSYEEVWIVNEPTNDDRDLYLDHLAGKTWNEEFVEGILSENKEAFRYFDQAAQKPKFQNPVLADPAGFSPDAPLVSMGGWRDIARLSSLKALYLARQGNELGAFNEAMKAVKIGQKIQESQSFLIGYLVAEAMKETGLKTTHLILGSSRSPAGTLIQYAKEMGKFKGNEEWLKTVFKGEYLSQSKAIDMVVSNNIKSEDFPMVSDSLPRVAMETANNFYFQPNKTRALFAGYARSMINNIEEPCGLVGPLGIKLLARPFSIGALFTENRVGKTLHDVIAVSMAPLINNRCEEDFLVSATQLLFAVRAYKIDNGNYPKSIAELVPRYIPEIPEDPFSGEAIKYSPEKRIIYSVGMDLIDSGGSESDDWRRMDDPTFKINF